MVDVREAVKIARNYLQEMFTNEADDIRLEEVEPDTTMSGAVIGWRVTLSFRPRSDKASGLLGSERLFKTFTIGHDGQVKSMKIRTVV